MEGLHFSTIDLRKKLSKGCINNNLPNYHLGYSGKCLESRPRSSQSGTLSACTVLLERDKGIPAQGDEPKNKIFIL